jgi:selenocysteine lyase/cysteine desulfurase
MAGVSAAVDYLAALGERLGEAGARRQKLRTAMLATSAYERRLSEKLVAGLLDIPSVEFFGIREPERFARRTPTVSIRVQGLAPRDVVERLAERGFFVWEGNYYALNLSERLGVIRIGCVHYNTLSEIDRLLEAIETLWVRVEKGLVPGVTVLPPVAPKQ